MRGFTRSMEESPTSDILPFLLPSCFFTLNDSFASETSPSLPSQVVDARQFVCDHCVVPMYIFLQLFHRVYFYESIMNFYQEAAKVLERLDAKKGSIKGIIACLPDKSRGRTAALVIETLKCAITPPQRIYIHYTKAI
jgi:hypothetical protein